MLRGRATVLDIRNLVADVDAVMSRKMFQEPTGDIVVDPSQRALLGWYLRKYNVKFSTTNDKPLIIIGRDDTQLPLGEWATQRYSISTTSTARLNNLDQFWRWFAYREAPNQIKYDSIVMYISL